MSQFRSLAAPELQRPSPRASASLSVRARREVVPLSQAEALYAASGAAQKQLIVRRWGAVVAFNLM